MGKLCSKEVVISHNSNIPLKNFGLDQVQNICETTKFNSLPNDNFLDWNKFKAFADDKCAKNELISIFYVAENVVGKRENTCYHVLMILILSSLSLSFSLSVSLSLSVSQGY